MLLVGHHHDARFRVERDELLQNAWDRQQRQCPFDIGLALQDQLSVAVVAQRAGLQYRREAQFAHRGPQRRFIIRGRKTRSLQSVVAGIRLFAQTVLRIIERFITLRDVVFPAQRDQDLARNVLEFVGHHVAHAAQPFERRGIVVGCHDMVVANPEGRSIRRRVEGHSPHAQHMGLFGDHQPQLSASDNSTQRSTVRTFRCSRLSAGLVLLLPHLQLLLFLATGLVLLLSSHLQLLLLLPAGLVLLHLASPPPSDQFSSAFRTSAVCLARKASSSPPASCPAAPGSKRQSVRRFWLRDCGRGHGNPAGICTIDSSESRPFRAPRFHRTPTTGSVVIEATMPGRCAAPPAPAIITPIPRSLAVLAYSHSRSGVRWALTTRFFKLHTERFEHRNGFGHHVIIAHRAHNNAYFHSLIEFTDLFENQKNRLAHDIACHGGPVSIQDSAGQASATPGTAHTASVDTPTNETQRHGLSSLPFAPEKDSFRPKRSKMQSGIINLTQLLKHRYKSSAFHPTFKIHGTN